MERREEMIIYPASQFIRDTTLMQLICINLLQIAAKNGGKGMLLKPGSKEKFT